MPKKIPEELRELIRQMGAMGGKKAAAGMSAKARKNRAKLAAATRWGKKGGKK